MLKKLSVVCIFLVASVHLSADVIPDNSSVGTQVKIEGSDFGITHGLQEGTSLFHSFRDFSIGAEESATFMKDGIRTPNDIRNILARVTGDNESEIFGSLYSDFGADLYLMNPNGIIFGENASLDVKGSFHATTADYLRLGKDAFFYANLSDESSFISATPAAFGFLSEQPAPITIKGENVFLEVPEENSLSMIGGDITIENSILYAPSGRINLAAVASEGEVEKDSIEINAIQKGEINLSHFSEYTDVEVDDKLIIGSYYDDEGELIEEVYASYANIDVSNYTKTAAAGQIFIRGGKFTVEEATILADTYEYDGEQKADTGINIAIDGNINLIDNAVITADNRQTDIQKKSGDITIKAENLTFQQTQEFDDESDYFIDEYLGIISTDSFGPGTAGDINIKLTGSLDLSPGGILSSAQDVVGNAGNIDIKARKVSLQKESMIMAESFGGYPGNIVLNTSELRLMDRSIISNSSEIEDALTEYTGGNITLNVRDMLYLRSDSWISAKTFSSKHDAGNITIRGSKFFILDKSQVAANAEEEGDGGNINIDATHFIPSYPFEKREKVSFDKIRFPDSYEQADIEMSSIDASSKAGKPGKIWINTSQEDFSQNLTLPKVFFVDGLSLDRCAGFSKENISRFLVIARDALPPAPTDLRTHLYVPQ